jgi:excisionase family DNA binding protein
VIPTPEQTEVVALKTSAAAHRLSLSERTLRKLVERGVLHPNRSTRHMLFPIEELDRWLESPNEEG